MKRLDFVCVGPQKTSTSWLDAMLRQHPGLALPQEVKETFFFDANFRRGYDWYWSLFGADAGQRLLGEIGPSYFDDAAARQRLKAHNPAARIIVCLRDPVERTYSLYCHHYARQRVKGSFESAVREMPRIVSSGDYLEHAQAWAADFSPGQLLFIRQEDVAQRPAVVLDAVCRFLGLEPVAWHTSETAVYQRPSPRSLLLSGLAARVARFLRSLGLHRAIQLADRLGVRKLVFGASKFEYPPLTEADRGMLTRRYAPVAAWMAQLDFSSGAVRGDRALLAGPQPAFTARVS